MVEERGHWPELIRRAAGASTFAIELAALSEHELPPLLSFLEDAPPLPFFFISVHAPSKQRTMPEEEFVNALRSLPAWIDAIVVHPDTIEQAELYRLLGRKLVLENMDSRKPGGRTVDEMNDLLEALPDAGLCFDIAHAKSVDPSMEEGKKILDAWGHRLRHVHLSSLDSGCHHVSLSLEDEQLFWPLLMRCRDVPWILEAAPRAC